MHIYFARHAESMENEFRRHQNPDVPLSLHGREEAKLLGKHLKKLGITHILSSDMLRAKETAEVIQAETGLSIELSPLFREVARPSSLYTKRHFGLATYRAGLSMLMHGRKKEWHYEDEENLSDIEERIKKAVAYLGELSKTHEHIAVISHSFIINLFVLYMCAHDKIRMRDFVKTFFRAAKLKNGSITEIVLKDDGNPLTCDFMVTSFNSTEHLREA